MYTCPSCGCSVSNPHVCPAATSPGKPDTCDPHEVAARAWEEAAEGRMKAAKALASELENIGPMYWACPIMTTLLQVQALNCRARAASERARGK